MRMEMRIYPLRLVASMVEEEKWLLSSGLCENLVTVGDDIEGGEELGEAEEVPT